MALQTLQERILSQLGDTIGGVMAFTALWVKDQVNLGIRVIVGRTPLEKCKQIYPTKPVDFAPDTGLVLETSKIITATREDGDSIPREAKELLWKNISRAQDVNSLYAPSIFKPQYVLEPQTAGTYKIKMFPASTSSIATVVYVSYPEVDPSSAVTLAGFPEELEPFVDLYVVIQGKIRSLGYYRKLINDVVSNITGSVVIGTTTFTSQTTVNVTHNAGVKPIVQILDENDILIGGTVTHNTVNDFTVTFLFSQTGTILTSVGASSGGDLVSFINSLPTWSAISMGTMPTVPTLEADASGLITSLPTPPTIVSDISAFITANALPFTPPIVSDISSFIAANALPTTPSIEADAGSPASSLPTAPTVVSDISAFITANPLPTVPTIVSDISTFIGANALPSAPTIVSDISSFIAANALPTPPTIVSDISSFITANPLPTPPTLEADASGTVALLGAIPTFDGTTTITLADISTTRIVHNLNTAADLIWKEQDGTDDISKDVEGFLESNDSEMANEASKGANSSVNIAKGELETELGKLRNWEGEYNAKVKDFSAQIDAWLGRWKTYTDEDKLKIEQFISDLNSWTAHWKTFVEEDKIAIEKYLADLRVWDTNWKAYNNEDKIAIENYLALLQTWVTNWKAYTDEDKIAIENYSQLLNAWNIQWKAYNDEDTIALANYDKLLKAWQTQWSAYTDEDKIAIEKYLAGLNVWGVQWQSYVDEDNIKIKKFLGDLDSWIKHWKAFVDEDTVAISKYGVDLKAWDIEWKAYNDEDKIALEKYLADLNVWLGKWKAYVDEDSLKISIYKEAVTEVIVTYRADIENEAQRFGLGIQKSRSHLESAKIRSGIVAGYLQSLGLIPNEITELQRNFDIGVNNYLQD